MSDARETPPILQEPGKGLSFPINLISRYVVFPLFKAFSDQQKRLRIFRAEADIIAGLLAETSEVDAQRPVLVGRIPGMEDSSRYWSLAMVAEHLVMVNSGVARVIETLVGGEGDLEDVDVADFKPKGGQSRDQALAAFRANVEEVVARISALGDLRRCHNTHVHPWFGPLTPPDWLALGAIHIRIHRKQARAIAGSLSRQD
jgi:hypothetical protein